jgi:ribosomal protein S18 acetylase RimI-like enzyme
MIREACISDFAAISNLEKQVFNIHLNARPDMIKPKMPFNKDYYETSLNDDNVKIFVYEENGEIFGYCITKKWGYSNHHLFYDMTILDINDMCVDEKARGKNIGRQLFNRAKDYAKEIGAAKIELSVWNFNKNARQFYEHLGMAERISRMEIIIE